MNNSALKNGLNVISSELGILRHIFRLTMINKDPKIINYGIWPCNTEYLSDRKHVGQSAGCGFDWTDSVLGAIGETVERYAPAFFPMNDAITSSYKKLKKNAIHPSEFALFHEKQYNDPQFHKMVKPFTEETELIWIPCNDLTSGKEVYVPAQFIYMPFNDDGFYVNISTSTGLAAHTNYYKAILNGIYESIERDSFSLTWFQKIVPPKIIISKDIEDFINKNFNTNYEWHLFDITYDLKIPTTFGFCFGETEYGKFVAVGASTRSTLGESLLKTIQEIGQSVPCFRFMLEERKEKPVPEPEQLWNFDDHSWYYIVKPESWTAFDRWRNAVPSQNINWNEMDNREDADKIKDIVGILKDKNYNLLVKDLTTPDLRQVGFFSMRVYIPQLIQLSGAYKLYHFGGKRLYEVPNEVGYKTYDFDELNRDPHPFP